MKVIYVNRTNGCYVRNVKKRQATNDMNKRMITGGEIGDKVFQDNEVKRASDLLKNITISSKPKVSKKFISLI